MRKSPKTKLTKSAKKLVVHVEKYMVELRETKYYCDLCGTTYQGYDSTSVQEDGKKYTPEELWNNDKNGDLSHVFELYWAMRIDKRRNKTEREK